MKDKTSVLLVDDQKVFAESLKTYLEEISEELQVIGIASNGSDAIELVEKSRPNVVLMDVRMPNMNGVEAIKVIRANYPETKVLMLTTFDNDDYIHAALQNGAAGYLLKEDIDGDELLDAIRAAVSGSVLFSPQIAVKLVGTTGRSDPVQHQHRSQSDDLPYWFFALSKKERKILKLILEGFENSEISDQMHLVEQTVKNYISIIYSKLGTHNRSQTIKVAHSFYKYL
jgi:DNA-binding NarL/FixJ family response regulator